MNFAQQADTYPANAVQAAAIMEGDGEVLNDYYTLDEYIARRGNLLGKHPEWSHLPNACWVARTHAGEVFDGDEGQQLSVQEVRKREIETQQDPLLPLPTKTNTDTIDGYASYGPTEWTPGTAAYHPRFAASPTPPPSEHLDSSTLSASAAEMPALRINTGDAVAAESMNDSVLDLTPAPTDCSHTQRNALLSTPATSLVSDKMADTSFEQTSQHIGKDTALATLANIAASQLARDVPSSHTMAMPQDSNLPAYGSSTQQQFTVAPGVSALAKHGMQVPIKKRKRDQAPDAYDATQADFWDPITEDDTTNENIIVQAAKRPRVNPSIEDMVLPTARIPSPAGKKGVAAPVQKGVAQPVRKGIAGSKSKAAASVKTTANTVFAKNKKGKPKNNDLLDDKSEEPFAQHALGLGKGDIAAVVNGDALPAHQQEAIQASKQRHARLLAAAQSSVRGRKTTQKKLDLLPEFFEKSLFAKGEESDSVRCICGRTHDDGVHMVSCEKCEVWQHSHCMLPGFSRKEVEGYAGYLCQVCGPWERREVVKKMRKARGVV